MDQTTRLVWPVSRLADAVEQLAVASGLTFAAATPAPLPLRRRGAGGAAAGMVDQVSRGTDVEVESGDVRYADVDRLLKTSGPALFTIGGPDQEEFLTVISSSAETLVVLAPGGTRHRLPVATAAEWVKRHLDSKLEAQVDRLLTAAEISEAKRARARHALLATRLNDKIASRCWLLRPAPRAPLWHHVRHARLPRRLGLFVLAYAGAAFASVGAWWLIGSASLEGRFDSSTQLAWSFLFLSLVPLTLFARWAQGIFMIGVSGILKQRLLAGALQLDPNDTRHHGVGRHLARVLESESLEALSLAGGFYALTGGFELALAAIVFAVIGAKLHLTLLATVLVAFGVGAWVSFRRRERSTAARLHLTHDLVERMVGHRTRLIQEAPTGRHDDEDDALRRHVDLSRAMDRANVAVGLIPRTWLLMGIAALAPQFLSATPSVGSLAAALGATLLTSSALGKATASLNSLMDALVSWSQIQPLAEAVDRVEAPGHAGVAAESSPASDTGRTGPLVVAQDLRYQYPDRAAPILRGCSFRIAEGDRIHLTGASGGGKSTLVSMLTAVREPDAGLLLLDGLDRATLGTRLWRRRIAAAPQFYENHLFSDTLAFNLLMGRRWPAEPDDIRWAELVCRKLGLGDLIDRMPNGLFQIVGETGWQLSHGERSRVYMARALLQGAGLVVLDESFAELDPENLQRCLAEAAQLSKALLVVAHA
jgi:ATP-binding cassette subfamily B protein